MNQWIKTKPVEIEVKISQRCADHLNSFGINFGFWDQSEDYQVSAGETIEFLVERIHDEDPTVYSPKMIDMYDYVSEELESDIMSSIHEYLEENYGKGNLEHLIP